MSAPSFDDRDSLLPIDYPITRSTNYQTHRSEIVLYPELDDSRVENGRRTPPRAADRKGVVDAENGRAVQRVVNVEHRLQAAAHHREGAAETQVELVDPILEVHVRLDQVDRDVCRAARKRPSERGTDQRVASREVCVIGDARQA